MAKSYAEYLNIAKGALGKRGAKALGLIGGKKHKRVRRIVFSERQWNFVAQLINSVGRRGRVPKVHGGRYHSRRKRFF